MSQAAIRSNAMPVAERPVVMLFPGAGRKRRLWEAEPGPFPREFFYGTLDLAENGLALTYADTRQDPDGFLGNVQLLFERARNRVSRFGLSRQRVAALKPEIEAARLAVSFTDGFSLSLGRYRNLLAGGTTLVGGFQGLADMPDEVAQPFRSWACAQIRKGILGLDHLFFLGDADRQEAIRRFDIPERKTSLLRFGVDTEFWTPANGELSNYVLSVGSDPKRDYATLLAVPISAPLRIITRLKLPALAGRTGVEIIRGSYHNTAVTDTVLRTFYRDAAFVVVPVRDVFQPSGCSVTLQAMACGKAVVLSRIKGLWDPDVFVSGENCLLIEPENPQALADAVSRLHRDPTLCKNIGEAARQTAVRSFSLQRMNESLAALVGRCRNL